MPIFRGGKSKKCNPLVCTFELLLLVRNICRQAIWDSTLVSNSFIKMVNGSVQIFGNQPVYQQLIT